MSNEVQSRLTPYWTDLRPHPKQSRLWREPKRLVGVKAGRRSGKTELARRRLVRFLPVKKPWPDPLYLFAGPTINQVRRIGWEPIVNLIPENWIVNINHSLMTVDTIFGSRLICMGMEKPQRAEGVPYDGVVLDESSDLKKEVYTLSIFPALSDRDGWCWRIGIPKRQGVGAKAFTEFCERGKLGTSNVAYYHWISEDILTPEQIKEAKEELSDIDYREQYEATDEEDEGRIFHAFERSVNLRDCQYSRSRQIIVGCDFNVNPMCWVLMHRHEDVLEVFDEIWLRNTNTQRTLDHLASKYADHEGGWLFIGDASGRADHTSAQVSDYLQIKNEQRLLSKQVNFALSNPAIVDRFAATNARLKNANGLSRLFINPRCEKLIEDLEYRHYKEDSRKPDDSADVGHMTDALGYPVHRLFPVRLQVVDPAPIVSMEF